MSTSARGNAAERKGAKLLEDDGWLVASRRHIGGAGDLLAIKPRQTPMLVEVKTNKVSPWQNFRWRDRADMLEEAAEAGAEAWLLWMPSGQRTEWIHCSLWPEGKAGLAA